MAWPYHLVDHHVGWLGHVAFDAKGSVGGLTLENLFVEMMLGGVISVRPMALQAEVVALEFELHAVGVVAIRTTHVIGVHL